MVLGANWCSHSTWEQHTVVYLICKNLLETSYSNIYIFIDDCNHSVLDPGQAPEIKGVTRSALGTDSAVLLQYNPSSLAVVDLMGVDFLHMSISVAPPKYPL